MRTSWIGRRVQMSFVALAAAATMRAGAQDPATLAKVGSVSPRFDSYNVEMVEVTGGRFWKPYSSVQASAPAAAAGATPGGLDPALFEQRTPIDLSNPRLRKLAKALGPAYMRVSGTWQNSTYFQDSDGPTITTPKGFGGVLTRAEWKGVVDFAKAVDAKLVTSFATSMGTRDSAGVWTPVEAKKFMAYNDRIGGPIAASEFMNEPTFVSAAGVPPGYDAAAYGKDFLRFRTFLREAAPHAIVLGPGSVGEGIDLVTPGKLLPSKDLMAASGPDPVDAFSYHFYGSVSSRCASMGAGGTTPEAALTAEWLDRTATVEDFYAKLRDEYAPGKPMWLTETGQVACGGDRWASTYLDTFRYVNQMGALAKKGVQVIMHNTLAASDYALIDEKTLLPRPNYWASLLWHNLMGTTVLDAGANGRVYAQCLKGKPGGVAMVVLNLDPTHAQVFALDKAAMQYTLTAPELQSKSVMLNGKELRVSTEGDVPELRGVSAAKGNATLPAASITYLTFADAGNAACR